MEATNGSREMWRMKFENLAIQVQDANLHVEDAMDLLTYVNALRNFGACGGDQEVYALRMLQLLTPPNLDQSCDSSERGHTLHVASPTIHGTHATDDIPDQEVKSDHNNLCNTNQGFRVIRRPDGTTSCMLGHPLQSSGSTDALHGIDQSFCRSQSAKRMVYQEHQLVHGIFEEEATTDTDQMAYKTRSAKDTFYPEHRHANSCSSLSQGPASSTFAPQCASLAATLDPNDRLFPVQHQAQPMLQKQAPANNMPLPGKNFVPQSARSLVPMAHFANNRQFPEQHQVPPMLQIHAPANDMQLSGPNVALPMRQRYAPARTDFHVHIAGNGESQKQALLVCIETVKDMDGVQELAKDFRHEKFFYFRTAVKFTRWLFKQHRGLVSPWSLLIVGWRECKPCMAALEAAFSADMSKVRPDAKRSALKQLLGGQASERRPVRIAVATMVVLLDTPSQHERAQTWANQVEGAIPDLKIVIAESLAEISQKFGSGQQQEQQQQSVALPVDGMLPQRLVDPDMQYLVLSV